MSCGHDRMVYFWNIETNKKCFEIPLGVHEKLLTGGAFLKDNDNQTVLTISDDGVARVFKVPL